MKRTFLRLVAMFAIAYTLGCSDRQSVALGAPEQAALRTAFDAYFSAANATDGAAWARLYTPDAVMMPPGTVAIQGRMSIEEWLSKLPVIRGARGTVEEVSGVGDSAYVRGTYSMTLEIPGLPQPLSQEGKLLQIYARQPNGSWLLSRDIWNANAP